MAPSLKELKRDVETSVHILSYSQNSDVCFYSHRSGHTWLDIFIFSQGLVLSLIVKALIVCLFIYYLICRHFWSLMIPSRPACAVLDIRECWESYCHNHIYVNLYVYVNFVQTSKSRDITRTETNGNNLNNL